MELNYAGSLRVALQPAKCIRDGLGSFLRLQPHSSSPNFYVAPAVFSAGAAFGFPRFDVGAAACGIAASPRLAGIVPQPTGEGNSGDG
jgi:hypothetical protein